MDNKDKVSKHYFDQYPLFYESKTHATPYRLHCRQAAIFHHPTWFKGASVLDIASNDGRWSFAALKAGAKSVVGIEYNERLVKVAHRNLNQYGFTEANYRIYQGDIHEELGKVPDVQVAMCLGFLYHTPMIYNVIKGMVDLNPDYMVIDTEITTHHAGVALFREVKEKVRPRRPNRLSSTPSRELVHMTLRSFGYKTSEYAWNGVKRQADIDEYKTGRRITVYAEKETDG